MPVTTASCFQLLDAASSKRSRVKTERMQEFEKSQEDNVTQKLLKCPKDGCDKVFTSVPGLRYHTKTHIEPDRRFICAQCDKSFKSANGLKYHKGKTKGCDFPNSGYQSEKHDKSSNSEGEDTEEEEEEDSGTEDFASQEMSCDELHNNYHHHQQLHMNDNDREDCHSVSLTETSDDQCAIKSKPMPLMLSTASETTVVATPSTTSWSLMNDNCTSDVNKLQQLAIIATGPESPLLKPETSLTHMNMRVRSDGSDPQVTSSSPCPTSTKEAYKESGTWSHTWPTTVWQCFMKGVQIQFPENTWQNAEELARIEQLRKSSSGKENSQDGYAAKGLRLVRMTRILEEDNQETTGKSWHLHLNMSPDLDNQSSLLAKCAPDHPFFVMEKGWSSYSPAVTVEHYGIPCRKLEEDDICLPPSHNDATFTHDVFETLQQSLDFTPSDSSAVLALSNMAKQRRDLEQDLERRNQENLAKKQNAIKTDSLKAKRPMNGFMLFAKKNRLGYTQMYPGKDNRAISVMLGDRWKKMKTEERSVFAEEAKYLAEQQKRIHPDCWKRKSVKS